jgi:hypothetical protein
MDLNSGGYELLNFVWLEGFKPFYFDGKGQTLRFSTLEGAIAELQDDFDTVAREIEDGEREADCGFSPDEFQIRCVDSGERFDVDLIDGIVRVRN